MRSVPFFSATLVLLAAQSAFAQVDEERLKLMHEPISYTDVIDAFDGPDRFDLNVHLDYARTRETGAIYRERTASAASGDARGEEKVAAAERIVSQIVPGFDLGLFRDVMAFVRMPLILSDSRNLTLPHGVSAGQAGSVLTDAAGQGGPGSPLFSVPFSSPTRAGVDYLAVGVAWAPFNQTRRAWLPTWVLRLEGRRAVGHPLRACHPVTTDVPATATTAATTARSTSCGSISSEDRNGDGKPDGTHDTGTRAGSSRGVSALFAETRFSHRYRRYEPYAGLSLLVEWASSARDAFRDAGYGHARPGPQTAANIGLALIPWEDRGAFQRIVFDLRLNATHVARGTDYTPLFDALGTSSNPDLASARSGVSFYGLTEVQSYLRYGGQLGVEVQAARYVRFQVGSQLSFATDHALTGRDPCGGPSSGVAADGRICTAGGPDRRERGVIDAPGRRFLIRDQMLLGVFAQATASF